jgi:acetylornithine deacetylase/succinyl-diaminopimelate desuccinylase-like protein
MNEAIKYIERNYDRYLEELNEFLRIPSVSTDPSHTGDVKRAAEYVVDQLEKAGMERAEIFPTEGHPIVYGEHVQAEDKPTVLIYGHYDVQPVDPIELWQSPPFEPDVRNGELYARGAADDKGQVFIHFKAAEAYIESGGQLPLNIKYLIEGEEEIGSPHLDSFIESHRDLLMADVVMVSDTTMFARGVPSICYGLRGLVYFQIDVSGANSDLHSGSFGGPVANPSFELAKILTTSRNSQIESAGSLPVCPLTKKRTSRKLESRNFQVKKATHRWSNCGPDPPLKSTGCSAGLPEKERKRFCPLRPWQR